MNKVLAIILVTISVLSLAACSKQNTALSEKLPKEQSITDVSVYFPIDSELAWIYEGTGNEYAGFTRKVIRRQDNMAQFSENNGGTQMGLVYQVTPEAVILTHAVEEYYSDGSLLSRQANRNEVLLKAPLKPGASWQDVRYKREVVSIADTITVPGGTFTSVIRIKSTPLNQINAASLLEYYAPGVGLIAREYTISQAPPITSRLKAWNKH